MTQLIHSQGCAYAERAEACTCPVGDPLTSLAERRREAAGDAPSPRARTWLENSAVPEGVERANNDRARHRDYWWAWCEHVRQVAAATNQKQSPPRQREDGPEHDRRNAMNDIENTSQREPIEHLAGAMVEGTEGYITGMEAVGQAQLVNSTELPYPQDKDDTPFIALGFEFGESKGGDDLFREAKLPEGWSREGSDHSMWSYIVDEQGFRRVAIFYKAAFYDRRADMHIERVPATRAQSDAYEDARPPEHDTRWRHGRDRRDGDNYVYCYDGCYGDNAPEGKRAYDDDGRRYEAAVAPDGTVLDRREFTVDPPPEREW